MWAKSVFLLCFGFQLGKSLNLSPCNDGYLDIPAGQQVNITCSPATETLEWRLSVGVGDDRTSYLLASLDEGRIRVNFDVNKTFVVSDRKSSQTLSINTANNRNIQESVSFLNGTVVCQDTSNEAAETRSCGLNYVYPSQGVMCTAEVRLWDVHVTCNITSAYSSQRRYLCQLFREKRNAPGARLMPVPMETKSTSEIVSKGEVKVSGYCSVKTTLPAETGEYAFWVLVSPGGIQHAAHNALDLRVDQPPAPNVACFPKSNLTINSIVNCTCQTAGLGQPAGSLTWVVDDKPDKGDADLPHQLSSTRTFKLKHEGATEFRCDVTWGEKSIKGQSDTCYAPCSGGANVVLNTKSRGVVAGGIVTVAVVTILGLW